MFRRLDDVRATLEQEAQATLRILEAIPDAALEAPVAEGHRTLRRLAWHLVESRIEMPGHLGLAVEGRDLIGPDGFIGAPPATGAELRGAYAAASTSLLRALEGWTDADLDREDDLYGQRWSRGRTFTVLVLHEAHHRGQMTVLMRQAGLPVPGVYGPSREEWAGFGMAAPAV